METSPLVCSTKRERFLQILSAQKSSYQTLNPDLNKITSASFSNVSCSRHFRPKLVHWNESIYCTPIDRALKMRFNKGSGQPLRATIPELWRFLWISCTAFRTKRIHKYKKIFNNFSSQNFLPPKSTTKYIIE